MTSRNAQSLSVSKTPSISSKRSSVQRRHGRITKDDIRSAGLRRWNGRSRITTDWVNLYHEPELCFTDGDLLVYLRQPGQSSRGPAFQVHTSVLQNRGFQSLLDQCVFRQSFHSSKDCKLNSCPGCDKHASTAELYIPAPFTTCIDTIFDHHITTRNFFAWLYDLPLAGRALGVSFVTLEQRIGQYRDAHDDILNKKEIINYAESQKYLDFRECVDHALAALYLAEHLRQEDMWIDAFAHVVGMSHRDIGESLEYAALNSLTQSLILESRLEMDVRLARSAMSIETFFGDDLSGKFLGLSQSARDHFDRFRSFLHSFYIKKYGFWPPAGLDSDPTRYSIYATLYSDFRTLYHHLVDANSSPDASDHVPTTGGVCTVQNIQAFDSLHGYETLPRPLPQLPKEPVESVRVSTLTRRRSWNPVLQKRMEKEAKQVGRTQALINASNRDMTLMRCQLVRAYSEYEAESIVDPIEQVSWVDGRKVRWILIYAILQTLISIMAAPKYVRNTEGLSYSLCCHIPTKLPWMPKTIRKEKAEVSHKEIVPDIDYRHSNSSTGNIPTRSPKSTDRKDRRFSMISQSGSPGSSLRSPSLPRAVSLKRLLSKKRTGNAAANHPVPALPTRPHCEILVHGYGNGLNEVTVQDQNVITLPTAEQRSRAASLVSNVVPDGEIFQRKPADQILNKEDHAGPHISPGSSTSVSRETSNASTGSAKSKSSNDLDEIPTPVDKRDMNNIVELIDLLKASTFEKTVDDGFVYDEIHGLPGSIHICTKTWDEILG